MKIIGYWAIGGEKNRKPGDLFVSLDIFDSEKFKNYYKQNNYTLIPSYICE